MSLFDRKQPQFRAQMDFNEAYDDTNTSVGLAARSGNVVLLKELLHKGYPTYGHDNRGWRPLHEAAKGGHVECVRLLLAAEDAEVDALSHEGLTALQLACEPDSSHTEVVKLLLCAGADPNMKCGDDWDLPLPKAVLHNLYDIVKLLLDAGGDPNRADYKTGSPLMAAAEMGHVKIAQLLIERGARVDYKPDGGHSAIHIPFLPPYLLKEESTLLQFINLLADKGCNINALMSDGTTPLMLAIQANMEAAVIRLLELGADPNIVKDDGVMALHYAIEFCPDSSSALNESGSSEDGIGDRVLKKILDLTSRDLIIPAKLQSIRYSIFHLAVEWDRFNTLKLLVNAGLPPDAFLQETPNAALDEADVNLFSQVPMVIDLGTEVDTPLGFLLSKPLNEKRVEMAKYMIDKGSKVDPVTPRCLPPLVAAVKHQRATYDHSCPGLEIIKYLLEKGTDVMHKIRETDVLPAALHISSLFNVHAFFALLVRCVPVHEIYTPETLESLSQLYNTSSYYKIYPLFPWRVVSWLNVVNMFVPQLPLDMKNMFDMHRMVEDDNLSTAWDTLDAQIGSPKKLEQLCVLTVRRVVGERNGWSQLSTSLQKLTLMNEPLPELIMDLLELKQIESTPLYQWPPRSALPGYLLPAVASSKSDSDTEGFSTDEEDVLDLEPLDDVDDTDDDDAESDEDDDNDDEENNSEDNGDVNDAAVGAEDASGVEDTDASKRLEDTASGAEDTKCVEDLDSSQRQDTNANEEDSAEEEKIKRKKLKTEDE